MRVLVFGSRDWEHREQVFSLLDGLLLNHTLHCACLGEDEEFVVIEGQCPYGGADKHAEDWAKMAASGHPMIPWKFTVEHLPFPANWDKHKKAAGPIRNREMAFKGKPTVAYGFINKPLAESRGSKDMWEVATGANIPTYLIWRM